MPPDIKAEVDRLKKENEEYSARLAVVDVVSHPKFQAYFKGKVDEQIELAKEIVGNEKAETVAKVLLAPDSDYKNLQIEEIVNELTPLQQMRFGPILNSLKMIEREKASEIAKANESKTKLAAESATKTEKVLAENKRIFADVVKSMQDPKNGMAVYQMRDGDEKWNAGVKSRIAQVEKILFGAPDIKPQDVVKHAMNAAAFPVLLDSYRSDLEAKDGEITKLKAQVAELTAAQPTKGGTSSGEGGSEPTAARSLRGMTPQEAAAAWMKNLIPGD